MVGSIEDNFENVVVSYDISAGYLGTSLSIYTPDRFGPFSIATEHDS